MRVSPGELKAVRTDGIVTRYALLGEAAFFVAELPETGSAGTRLEEACRLEHWGLVLRGELHLEGRRRRSFGPGSAFYVAPGPVHRFRSPSSALVAGFAPTAEQVEALRAEHVEVVRQAPPPPAPPSTVRIEARSRRSAATGRIETESAVMGAWLVTRSTHGRLSGYAEDWCDLPHWGLVLDGSPILHWEHRELELLGPGDLFYCPPGRPGHRIEAADRATIIDYTPIRAFRDATRRRARRTAGAYGGPFEQIPASEDRDRPAPT